MPTVSGLHLISWQPAELGLRCSTQGLIRDAGSVLLFPHLWFLVVFLCFPAPFYFQFTFFIFHFFIYLFFFLSQRTVEYKAWDKFSACSARGGYLGRCVALKWYYKVFISIFWLMNTGACSSHCTCADAVGPKVDVMSLSRGVNSLFLSHSRPSAITID